MMDEHYEFVKTTFKYKDPRIIWFSVPDLVDTKKLFVRKGRCNLETYWIVEDKNYVLVSCIPSRKVAKQIVEYIKQTEIAFV